MIDINEARKHLEAMTGGTWSTTSSPDAADVCDVDGAAVFAFDPTPRQSNKKEAESIVYMRSHFAELLDEVERLRTDNKKLKDEVREQMNEAMQWRRWIP